MAARRKGSLLPLRPRLIPPRRLLLAATVVAAAIAFLFLVIVLVSTSPSSPPSRHHVVSSSPPPPPLDCGAASLGELGNALVSMLPEGLPFTVFAPSADAFRRLVLNNLRPNGSAAHGREEQLAAGDDNTYAVLSRVLGFSAVPRRVVVADVAPRGGGGGSARDVVLLLDSVSGLRIRVARDDDAGGAPALVANGVRSECVDVVRGETVVHVVAGVLMDAEFDRSFAAGFGS